MNTKKQVMSGIIGGIVGSIITALVMLSGTVQRDKFGDIECTSLSVVDADGSPRVRLYVNEGLPKFLSAPGVCITHDPEHGGEVSVFGNDMQMSTWDKNGYRQ